MPARQRYYGFMPFAERYKAELARALDTIDLERVETAIALLAQARDENRRIFVFGNGGSASTASHFVTDMVKGDAVEALPPLPNTKMRRFSSRAWASSAIAVSTRSRSMVSRARASSAL